MCLHLASSLTSQQQGTSTPKELWSSWRATTVLFCCRCLPWRQFRGNWESQKWATARICRMLNWIFRTLEFTKKRKENFMLLGTSWCRRICLMIWRLILFWSSVRIDWIVGSVIRLYHWVSKNNLHYLLTAATILKMYMPLDEDKWGLLLISFLRQLAEPNTWVQNFLNTCFLKIFQTDLKNKLFKRYQLEIVLNLVKIDRAISS